MIFLLTKQQICATMEVDAHSEYKIRMARNLLKWREYSMLFVNRNFSIQNRPLTPGGEPVPTINLGTIGHGAVLVPVPEQKEKRYKGLYKGLDVTHLDPANGYRPSIIKQPNSNIHLLLTSRPLDFVHCDDDYHCHILAPVGQSVRTILSAESHRNHCTWHDAILEARPGDIYAVSYGCGDISECGFVIVASNRVIRCADYSVDVLYQRVLNELGQEYFRMSCRYGDWRDIITTQTFDDLYSLRQIT